MKSFGQFKMNCFRNLREMFSNIENRDLLCTHFIETLSLFRLVEKNFFRTEPHLEQYLGESTSFAVYSITK